MKYEIAKQLEDAGYVFPKASRGRWMMPNGDPGMPHWSKVVYVPTLEELIEACGEHIINIRKAEKWTEVWIHGSHIGVKIAGTPTEAVANLWLALHAT